MSNMAINLDNHNNDNIDSTNYNADTKYDFSGTRKANNIPDIELKVDILGKATNNTDMEFNVDRLYGANKNVNTEKNTIKLSEVNNNTDANLHDAGSLGMANKNIDTKYDASKANNIPYVDEVNDIKKEAKMCKSDLF